MKKIHNLQIASKQSFRCVKKLLITFVLVFGTTNALSAPPDLLANGPPSNPLLAKGTAQYGSDGHPHSDSSPTGLQSPSGSDPNFSPTGLQSPSGSDPNSSPTDLQSSSGSDLNFSPTGLQSPSDFGSPCPLPSSSHDATDLLHSHPLNPSTDPCLLSRVRRNANGGPLGKSVGKMQVVARVTNAISLQEGLKDGTLKPEVIVAELLYLGVAPDQIKTIDAEEFQKALNSLASIFDKLKKKEDVEEAEEFYLTLFLVRQQLNGVVNREKWVHKEDLQSDLTTLKKDGLKVALVDEISRAVKMVASSVSSITVDKNEKDDGRYTRFQDVKKQLGIVVSKIEELSELGKLDKIVMLPSGRSVNDSISDISKLSNAVNTIYDNKNKLSTRTIQRTNYDSNVELIETVSTEAENILPHLKTIDAVLQSRATPDAQRKLVNTAGFPEGNIWSLSNDFSNNQWLKELTDTKSLFQALTPFVTFGDFVQNINNGLESSKKQQASPTSVVLKFFKRLLASRSTPGVAKTITDGLKKCADSMTSDKDPDTFTTLLREKIHEIDSAISKIKQSLEDLGNLWTTKEASAMIKEVRDKVSEATSNDATFLQGLANDLAGYKKLKQFNKLLKDSEDLIRSVDQPSIKTSAADALQNFGGVNTLLDKVKDFDAVFTCLLGISEAQPVYDAIAKSRDLQKMTDPDRVSLKKSTDAVHQTLETLQKIKDAQTEVNKMKKATSPESAALSLLLNPKMQSNTIGSATRGIVSMQKAIDEKKEIDAVKGHLQDELKNAQQLTQDDKKKLQDLKEDLDKMSTALETWKAGIKDSGSTKLVDYAGIFSGAKNVAGIKQDLQQLRDWVEKSTVLTKKNELVAGLNNLISIGLKFSDYSQSFSDSPKTLGTLDMFFANYKTKLAPPTAAPQGQGQGGAQTPGGQQGRVGSAASGQLGEATPEPEGMAIWLICIIVVVCLAFVAGAIYGFVYIARNYCGCCPSEEPDEPDPEEQERIREQEQQKELIAEQDREKNRLKDDLAREQKKLREQQAENERKEKEQQAENERREKEDQDREKKRKEEKEANDKIKAEAQEAAKRATEKADKAEKEAEKANKAIKEAKGDAAKAKAMAVRAQKENELMKARQLVLEKNKAVEKLRIQAVIVLVLLSDDGSNEWLREIYNRLKGFQFKQLGRVKDKLLVLNAIFQFCKVIHGGIIGVIQYTYKGLAKEHDVQNRYRMALHENTRVIIDQAFYKKCFFPDDYIHANYVTFPDGKVWILAMAPLCRGFYPKNPDYRTDDKFWVMILQNRTEFILMLCDFVENGAPKACKYFPLNKGDVMEVISDKHQRVTVTCIEVEVPEEHVTIRTFEIRDVEHDITHQTVHKQYTGWPDHGAPKDPAAVARLFASIRHSQKVVIHCSAGLGRSGSVTLTEFYYQGICIQWEASGHTSAAIDYGQYVRDVRLQRAETVQEPIQMEFSIAVLLRFLFLNTKPKNAKFQEGYDNIMERCTADFEADARGEFLVKEVEAEGPKKVEGKEKGTKKTKNTKSTKVTKSKKGTKSTKATKNKKGGKKKPRAGDAPVAIDMEADLKKAEENIEKMQLKLHESERSVNRSVEKTKDQTEELSQQRPTKTPK